MIKFAENTTLIHNYLGSDNRIASGSGVPVQCMQYLAYDVRFMCHESKINTYLERFTSTGKELDEETGYNYHGARYYDAELLTSWTAVDPMADKYPGVSPYNYCAWNPVKLVDPDGNESIENDDWYKNIRTGEVCWHEGHKQQITDNNGDIYTNIGESYSKSLGNGTYINYFQNCAITQGSKEDAARLAYNDKAIRTSLIRKSSPLPMSHKQDLFNRHVASRGVSSIDMVGVQLSANVIVGGGFSFDATLGYIKESGMSFTGAIGAGCGFDISVGFGLCVGRCTSDTPSRNNFTGPSYSFSESYGLLFHQNSISVSQNNRWNVSTFGIGLGTTPISGSAGVSVAF